jgi:hypothetical protein
VKIEDLDQKYILDDDHNLVPATLMEWAHWFEKAERHVDATRVGPYWVSTVFLGINHRFGQDGPPLLFETMVFRDVPDTSKFGDGQGWSDDGDMDRYSTWDEALAGHERMVAKYRAKEQEDG